MADSLADLFVRLSGDTTDFKKKFDEASGQLSAFGNLSSDVGDTLKGFGEKITDFLEHPLKSAGEATKAVLESMGPLGVVAAAAGAGFAAVGYEIYGLVEEEGAAAKAIENLSYRLNLSYEDTKKLSEISQVAGVDLSVLGRVSMRLADALEDPAGAGKKVASALEDMGIWAADSGDALLKLLKHLAEIPDATQRINEAHTVMGKGAVQLEPLLRTYEGLSAAIEQLGGQLDKEGVAKLLEAEKASKLLGVAWDHLKEGLAATFAPAVIAGLEMLTNLFVGTPNPTLPKQIADVTAEIKQLEAEAKRGASDINYMQGLGLISNDSTQAAIAQKKALLDMLEAQQAAIGRSKEYNAELDESNAKAKKWALEADDRAKDYAKTQTIVIDAAAAHQKSLLNIEKMGYEEEEKLGLISAQANLPRLQSIEDRELAITEDAITKKRALVARNAAEEVTGSAKLAADLQKAEDLNAEHTVKLEEHVTATLAKQFEERVKIHIKGLNEELKGQQDVAAHVTALNLKMHDDQIKAQMEEAAGELAHGTKMLDLRRTMADADYALGLISGKQRIAIAQQVDADEEALDRQAINHEIALLDQRSKAETDYASKRQALLNKLSAMDDRHLADEQKNANALRALNQGYGDEEQQLQKLIADKEKLGADATREIVQLTALKEKTQQLSDASSRWGDVLTRNVAAAHTMFTQLEQGIATDIIHWKGFAQTLKDVFSQLGVSILSSLFKGLLLPLEDAFAKLVGSITASLLGTIAPQLAAALASKAIASALDADEISGNAAVAGSAVAAWTAAIPFVGPEFAVEAGLAMAGAIESTFLPAAAFATGGWVPQDMLAMVHEGEYVVPAAQAAQVGGGRSGPAFVLNNPIFNGVTPQLVDDVMNRMVQAARRTGAKI